MYYIKYNDIDLTEIIKVKEVEIPSLPTMSHAKIDIFERDGGLYNGLSYGARNINLKFIIQPANKSDYDFYVSDVKRAFYTKEPAPLYCGDETLYMWCVPVDDLMITELGDGCAEAEVNLISYDPYWYSTETKQTDSETKNFVVVNRGDLGTYPEITIGVNSPTTFVQVENANTHEKILLGGVPSEEKRTIAANTEVLDDGCESTANWVSVTTPVASNCAVSGTMGVTNSGAGICVGDFGSKSESATWHGPCYRKNLSVGISDFKVKVRMSHNSSGTNGDPSVKKPYSNETASAITGIQVPYYVTTCKTYMRKSRSSKGKVLKTLAKGTKIIKFNKIVSGWLQIQYNSSTVGYVNLDHCKKYMRDSTVTTQSRNYVTKTTTAIRNQPIGSSPNMKTIPAGTRIRCFSYTYNEKYYKMSRSYDKTIGYVLKDNLVEANDYEVEYEEMYETADDKTGYCCLAGYSSDGTQLFSLALIDDNKYYEFTYPLIKKCGVEFLKDKTAAPKPKIETEYNESSDSLTATKTYGLSGKYGDWNDFYGELYIERVDNVWYAYVYKMNGTEVVKKLESQRVRDMYNNKKDLSYIVAYFGTTDDANKASGMAISDISVTTATELENGVEYNFQEFAAGDVLEIDTSIPAVYHNSIEIPASIDVGSQFFKLVPGENEIRIKSDDTPIVTVMHREKYL